MSNMQTTAVSAKELHNIFENGYRNLKKNMETVNDLNVFPVPDGDTGTNMVKTFGGGIRAVSPDGTVGEYMKALSRAVLLSARGNSGVIFSQFMHGLCRGFEDKEDIVFGDFAYAFECAREDAYKSIISPTEGTMLTLIRETADMLADFDRDADMVAGFEAIVRQLRTTLERTPQLLPVLSEAGVVDSGGAGLVCFFEGMLSCLKGETVENIPDLNDTLSHTSGFFGPDSVLEYGYCTEFLLQLMNAKTDIKSFDLDSFVKPIEALGDSIVAVENDGIVKIHVHSFTPEKVLEYGRRFGEFISVKIENMSVQHSEVQESRPAREKVDYAVIAVASGDGIVDYFYSIGANAVIDGGQTNNPSVDTFLEAIGRFDAKHYILLPNNSNIILTAEQAAKMCGDKDIRIIPTRSVVEGYSALSMMNPFCETADEFVEEMSAGIDSITTGLVTTAVRDSALDGVDAKKGDYIGIADKTILCASDNRSDALLTMIKTVTEREDKEVIIVFYGASVSEEEATSLRSQLESAYPLCDIGFVDGKQEIYDFIVSLE